MIEEQAQEISRHLHKSLVQDDRIEPADPWKHRSEGMRCKTCMWFAAKKQSDGIRENPVFHLGRCRRHSPSMNGYPVVYVNDWCGDHKVDENKI